MEVIGSKLLYVGPTTPVDGVVGSIWIQDTTGYVYRCTSVSPLTYVLMYSGLDINSHRKIGTTHYEAWYTYPRTGDNLGAGSVAKDRLFAFPFVCPKQITIDRIGVNVTTGSAGNLRLGIYNDAGIYPGTLLLDSGNIDSAAPAGARSAVINQVLQANSLYWFAFVCSALIQCYCTAIGTCLHGSIMGSDPALPATPRLGIYTAYPFDALPATFPTPPDVLMTAAPIIAIFVRLSA